MKVFIAPILLSLLSLGWSVSAPASDNQKDMLEMLDQLDQLDRTDFANAIKAIYACSDRKDFKCADKKLATAKSLISSSTDKRNWSSASKYRQKAYEYAQAEKRQLALEKRQKTCASRCPIAGEYNRCVADRLSPRNCSSRPRSSYTPVSNLALLNNALQQLNTETKNYFQKKQQLLQQQQNAYEQQRRQQRRQQRLIAQQKRQWERAQLQQKHANQRREAELAALRKQRLRMRQQAERRLQTQPKLPSRPRVANLKTASSANSAAVSSKRNSAKPVLTGEMLTWQNKAGKWWACGPIQCIWASDDTEKAAISYVYDSKRTTYTYNGRVGKCKSYTVTGVQPYDMSSEKVRRLAKCF